MSTETFYITTAIDYVNSKPHIGTAFEKIGADAVARYHRALGKDVYFMIGADEHSTNIERIASEQGADPLAFCDEMVEAFKQAWDILSISSSRYIRTSEAAHETAVQELFRRVHDNGDTYTGKYEGWYCPQCEAYKREEDLEDGLCANHQRKPDWIEEENCFFKLTAYAERLLEHIEANPSFIEPEWRRNEITQLIRGGLEDVAMTRAGVRWGIQPEAYPEQTLWVWFDALINYITGIGFPNDSETFDTYWPCDVHVIGKDITRFHCVVWPAMLMAAGIPLPKQIYAHGFVYVEKEETGEAEKMSKTLGNAIDPIWLSEKYGPDAVRYFLLREINFGRDGVFSWTKFRNRYNSDLANDLGNLVKRTVDMTNKFLEGNLAGAEPADEDKDFVETMTSLLGDVGPKYESFGFHQATEAIWERVRRMNAYIEEQAPWKLNKAGETDRVNVVLRNLVEGLRIVCQCAAPVIPNSAGGIWEQLGLSTVKSLDDTRLGEAGEWNGIPAPHTVGTGAVLFPRIEDES